MTGLYPELLNFEANNLLKEVKREKRIASSSQQTKPRLTHFFLSNFNYFQRGNNLWQSWMQTLIGVLGINGKKLKIQVHQYKN